MEFVMKIASKVLAVALMTAAVPLLVVSAAPASAAKYRERWRRGIRHEA
jgi:hypothetical protein